MSIDSGIEPSESGSNQRIDSFFAFWVTNGGEYNQSNLVQLKLTEGATQVDMDSDEFDVMSNQLGNDKWGGSLEASDTSVQASAQYCYDLTGELSDSGQFPFSLDRDECLPPQLTFPVYDIWLNQATCFGPPDKREGGFNVLVNNSPDSSRWVDPITGSSAGSVCIYTQYTPPLQW